MSSPDDFSTWREVVQSNPIFDSRLKIAVLSNRLTPHFVFEDLRLEAVDRYFVATEDGVRALVASFASGASSVKVRFTPATFASDEKIETFEQTIKREDLLFKKLDIDLLKIQQVPQINIDREQCRLIIDKKEFRVPPSVLNLLLSFSNHQTKSNRGISYSEYVEKCDSSLGSYKSFQEFFRKFRCLELWETLFTEDPIFPQIKLLVPMVTILK